MKPYVFFDLDGTVCNSAEGILNAVTYAVDRMGLPRQDRRQMLRFIGPPLSRTFAADYHLSEADTLRAVEFYREYYNTRGIFECSLFDGIPALLDRLSAAGYGLVLATCKPAASARRVLEHFGLLDRFRMVSGPEFDGTRGEKYEVIDYAIETLGLTDRKRILMVGDRQDDILGARHCAVPAAGVLWGFGSKEELTAAGATVLFQTPAEAGDWLTQEGKTRG